MESKIKALGLGKNEEKTALSAIKTGKASKVFKKENKISKFYIHICKTSKVLKIHKIINLNGIKIEDKEYKYSLAA